MFSPELFFYLFTVNVTENLDNSVLHQFVSENTEIRFKSALNQDGCIFLISLMDRLVFLDIGWSPYCLTQNVFTAHRSPRTSRRRDVTLRADIGELHQKVCKLDLYVRGEWRRVWEV